MCQAARYRNNGLCNLLRETGGGRFYCANDNIWIMLYGNARDRQPYVLAVISEAADETEYRSTEPLPRELAARAAAEQIRGDLTFLEVRCLAADDPMTECRSFSGEMISLTELKQHFLDSGLEIAGTAAKKKINRYHSSVFHEWQRKNLGAGVECVWEW